MLDTVTCEGQIAVFEDPPGHTGILAGNWHVNPRMLRTPRMRAARRANDQRYQSTWGEYMLDAVTFEGQITVFEDPPGHTGILAGNWHVNPRMLGKPRLRAARYTNDQRHRSMWGEYMPDSVLFQGQNAVFRLPTSHTGFLAGIEPSDPRVLRKPGLRAARCTNDQCHRSMWGEYMPDPVTVEDQNAVFRLPTSHTGFLAGMNLRTHMCSESPGCKLQDAPMISAIRGYGGSICPIQFCFRVKTPHFDGLVRAPLPGPRISMATHICLESLLYSVSENTIKSGIRLILGSLHHFWSKRCDFCGVRHLLRSKFLIHWKALNNLYNCY